MASSSDVEVRVCVRRALQRALAASVSSGTFADTAYHLYSQRQAHRNIGKPRVVYGSSIVLKSAAKYFRTQLNEEHLTELELPAETEEYDYDSDSDLDDSEEAPDMTSLEEQLVDPLDTPCGMSPTLSDLDIIDIQSETETATEKKPLVVEDKIPVVQCQYRVAVPDVAANTWQALIHFMYTGRIWFSPLKSEGLQARKEAKESHRQMYPDLPPLCSPKSIYRLANMVGLTSLQKLAYYDIEERMSPEIMVSEIFSDFSSRYEDVLDMQLEKLYHGGMFEELMPEVSNAIASVCQGQKPHCNRALTALVQKLATMLAPLKPVADPTPDATPPYPASGVESPGLSPQTFLEKQHLPLSTHQEDLKCLPEEQMPRQEEECTRHDEDEGLNRQDEEEPMLSSPKGGKSRCNEERDRKHGWKEMRKHHEEVEVERKHSEEEERKLPEGEQWLREEEQWLREEELWLREAESELQRLEEEERKHRDEEERKRRDESTTYDHCTI